MITMGYNPGDSVTAVIQASNLAYKTTFKGLRLGIQESGDLLLRESRKIVPIDEGDLYSSGYSVTRGRSTTTVRQEVGYRMPYALRQHETPPSIYKHAPGKSWKYLEIPARRFRGRMADIVRKRAKRP